MVDSDKEASIVEMAEGGIRRLLKASLILSRLPGKGISTLDDGS